MKCIAMAAALAAGIASASAAAQDNVTQPGADAGTTASGSAPGATVPAKRRQRQPSYRWLELGLGADYSGFDDIGAIRLQATHASVNASFNARLTRHAYLVGEHSQREFDGVRERSYAIGPGFNYALTPATHLVFNLTYESIDVGEAEANGPGGELGVRAALLGGAELALSFKRQHELKDDDDDKQSFNIVRLGLVAPIARGVDVTFRVQRQDASDANAYFDSYRAGLRFRL